MEEQTTPEPAPAPKKKRGFGKLLLIVIPMLLIAGGGGWWYLAGSGGAVAAEETSNIEERGVVPFEPFLVNLSDEGGNRFLKATIQLVVESEAEAKHVEANTALMSHARSVILELLTEQKAQALVTTEGKKKLKEAIASAVATVLKKQKVRDVLFSEFVVQF